MHSAQKTFLELRPKAWRPIHYLGSKLRLTDSISKLLDDLQAGPVCDLFAGSGTVSLALSHSRDVLAADIQEYSRVICSAILKPVPISDHTVADFLRRAERTCRKLGKLIEPLLECEQQAIEAANSRPELLCDFIDHSSLVSGEPQGSLAKALKAAKSRLKDFAGSSNVTGYFGGRYFSFSQAIFIDSVLNECEGEVFLAALLSTTSDLVNSIGKQFAQPIRPRRNDGTIKTHLIRQICRDRCQDPKELFTAWLNRYRRISQARPHRVIRGDYRDVLADMSDIAVIYADPPYTRDHYSRFYHVLETLCLRDSPEVSTTFQTGPTSRGLYRADRHQSPFCIKSQAPQAFTHLFAAARGTPLLLSYSPYVKNGHPRMMTIEAVSEIAKQHYREVTVVPAKLAHSKLNTTARHLDALIQAEVFLLCR